MDLTLLLPWFPIVLAVGIGGRLLGQKRGLFLGIACALFWIVLVQATAGYSIWQDYWIVAAMIAGALAIVFMGSWTGESLSHMAGSIPSAVVGSENSETGGSGVKAGPEAIVGRLSESMEQFEEWLQEHKDDDNPWCAFDEFIRTVAHRCCTATHVKPYRLLGEGESLAPLRYGEESSNEERIPARQGIIGYVVTTGRRFLAHDETQGDHLAQLAAGFDGALEWVFAIRKGNRRLGVVTVGRLELPPEQNKPLLRAVERLINQFWCALDETICGRSAVQNDPVSGLPTRPAFLRSAERSLTRSYQQGEPVAMVVIAVEGLRELSDSGRWEVADELATEVSRVLRRKVRFDDRLGRFDDSQFILLLRRVDSELATLIVSQLVGQLTRLCADTERWHAEPVVRCGLVGSGIEQPDLNTLVFRALSQCRRARMDDKTMSSDVSAEAVVAEVVSGAMPGVGA